MNLWNDPKETLGGEEKYADHLLEQYKACLEVTDKVSDRRNQANIFFLTFHTAAIGAVATVYAEGVTLQPVLAGIFLFASLVFCLAWALILRHYRQLNSAKFEVIGEMEKRLPASPIYRAEWEMLKEGNDWLHYMPAWPIETFLPVLFATVDLLLVYLLMFSD
jgi:hypothetical protein